MDADEALARQLQAEEDAHAAQQRQQLQGRQRGSGDAAQQHFMRQLQSGVQTVLRYEVPGAQEVARRAMPLDRLNAAAADAAALSRHMGEDPPLHHSDALVQEMLAWFKAGFFTWVDTPPCECCGSRNTFGTGTEAPSPAEAADGSAGRTEVYRCTACSAVVRFPRFNDPVKLLRTRRGRCGEWANCFGLCLRAAGLEARWVRDWADHVWCEYRSEGLGRWVHADPCEAAWDRPLLYEAGWGKQQSYVVAFGRRGVTDVTRRYTANYAGALARRTLVSEAYLQTVVSSLSSQLRGGLPAAEALQAEAADMAEAVQLAAGDASASLGPLPGRQTGSVQWRATRGELGAQPVAALGGTHPGAKAPTIPPPATRWRRSPAPGDRGGGLHDTGCLVRGAAVRASGENAPTETADKVLDCRAETKWLDFGGGAAGQSTWLEVALLPDSQPAVTGRLTSYALTSAGDAPERDPADWVLEGLPVADVSAAASAVVDVAVQQLPPLLASGGRQQPAESEAAAAAAPTGHRAAKATPATLPDDRLEGFSAAAAPAAAKAAATAAQAASRGRDALQGWRVLDAQEGVRFSSRGNRLEFQLGGGAPACSRWRLTISRLRDPQAACAVQLAGLDLYCHPHGDRAPLQQLGDLSMQINNAGMAGTAAAAGRLTEPVAQPSSVPDSPSVPIGGASAAVTAGAAPSGSIAAQADAKAAFQRRVHVHFSRLMAGGGVSPAAAAAQALKLAAQG